jgi:hypothetical protein
MNSLSGSGYFLKLEISKYVLVSETDDFAVFIAYGRDGGTGSRLAYIGGIDGIPLFSFCL